MKTRVTKKVTLVKRIEDALNVLDINESISKKELVKELYGMYDHYIIRTFDVNLCKARKSIINKNFRVNNGTITRLK